MIGMTYIVNGTLLQTYYYHRNLQGDVIAIYDTDGNKQAEYAYDAFGNCEVLYSGIYDIGNKNPIRYRGYYYDQETGLYYLNARYYSPEWRRFISPDDTIYLDPDSVNGLNLYCYGGNNPLFYVYPSLKITSVPDIISISEMSVSTTSIDNTISGFTAAPLIFSIGVATPGKYDLPSWLPMYAFYVKGSLGWGYTFGDGYSIASFGIGILDVTVHTPKWFNFLLNDHLANPNIYFGIGTWNATASLGAGVSGIAEIISGTIGIQLGGTVTIGVKGYVGIGFTFDLTNGIKFGVGWGLGYEISLGIDWYELFH